MPIGEVQLVPGAEYVDSKHQPSTRRVACQRIERHGPHSYLFGHCLERQALRRFRVDRVAAVIDPATGEVHEPGGAWLLRFTPDVATASPLHFGLSVAAHANFIAALNVLAFLARCDGRWHDLENDAIEGFAASWWLRAEIAAPFDGDEVLRRAARLGPDPETFYLSLARCAADPLLRQILARHVAAVIDADGHHHPKELFWAGEVVEALRG